MNKRIWDLYAPIYEKAMRMDEKIYRQIYQRILKVIAGKIVKEFLLPADGAGHGALPVQLKANGVEIAICGGLGMGMLNALQAAGITVCANVTGDADQAVKDYLEGTLKYNTEAHACHGHQH